MAKLKSLFAFLFGTRFRLLVIAAHTLCFSLMASLFALFTLALFSKWGVKSPEDPWRYSFGLSWFYLIYCWLTPFLLDRFVIDDFWPLVRTNLRSILSSIAALVVTTLVFAWVYGVLLEGDFRKEKTDLTRKKTELGVRYLTEINEIDQLIKALPPDFSEEKGQKARDLLATERQLRIEKMNGFLEVAKPPYDECYVCSSLVIGDNPVRTLVEKLSAAAVEKYYDGISISLTVGFGNRYFPVAPKTYRAKIVIAVHLFFHVVVFAQLISVLWRSSAK